MRRSLLLLLPLLALAACTLGPDYRGPPPVGSAASKDARFVRGGDAVTPSTPAAAHWWTTLNDPTLNALEDWALAGNYNVAAAEARVREARSALRIERANELPQVAATAMYAHADLPPINLGGGSSDKRTVLNFYNVGFDASWEIDLFGGQRRTIEAARATLGASEASLSDAQVQLSAEVAQAYINLRDRQQRMAPDPRAKCLRATHAGADPAALCARHRFGARRRAAARTVREYVRAGGAAAGGNRTPICDALAVADRSDAGQPRRDVAGGGRGTAAAGLGRGRRSGGPAAAASRHPRRRAEAGRGDRADRRRRGRALPAAELHGDPRHRRHLAVGADQSQQHHRESRFRSSSGACSISAAAGRASASSKRSATRRRRSTSRRCLARCRMRRIVCPASAIAARRWRRWSACANSAAAPQP